MNEYHKIQTVFKRDPETKFKTLLEDEYSLPEFEYLKDNKWIFEEKVDGTNIRIKLLKDLEIPSYGGKTDNASIPTFLYDKLNEIFTNNKMKEIFPDCDVCFYGEGFGKKIQKIGSNYISDGVDFCLFDVKINNIWMKREDVRSIGDKFGLKCAPEINIGTLDDMVDMAKRGFDSKWGNFQAEGIVARPLVELNNRMGRRIITKIKCKDFTNS